MTPILLAATALATPPHVTSSDEFDFEEEEALDLEIEEVEPDGIIHGEDAAIDDYPMTGGLIGYGRAEVFGFEFEARPLMCSSTLIAPDVVLLAAHCIDMESMAEAYGVTVEDVEYRWSRQVDLSMYGYEVMQPWPEDSVAISLAVAHPNWDINALQTGLSLNHDIALAFLAEPVVDVPLGVVITAEEAGQVDDSDGDVAVIGWGQQTHVDGAMEAPPEGSVGIKQMGVSHVSSVAPFEFQVGLLESDVRKCHGDSGGPTFMWVDADTENTMRLIGVTSHSYDETDCAETGGVDTRVDFYLDWMDAEMRARCEDGTRSWCEEEGILPPDYVVGGSADDPGDGPAEEDLVADAFSSGDEQAAGCGCSGAPASGGAMFGLLLGLPLLRRRR